MIVKIHDRPHLNLRRAVANKLVTDRTVRNLLTSKSKQIVDINGDKFIECSELSSKVKSKLNQQKQSFTANKTNNIDEIDSIRTVLTFEYNTNSRWSVYLNNFNQYWLKHEEQIALAKTMAFFCCLLGYRKLRYSLKTLFACYLTLSKSFELVNFNCTNYNYFTERLKEMEIHGIERCLIHSKKGVRNRRKLSKVHVKYIIQFYS